MADLEGAYSAYVPASPKIVCDAVLNVAAYPGWWSRSVKTELSKGVKGKAVIGSRLDVKLEKATFEYEVRKIEMGKRIDLECVGGSYRGPAFWTFAPEKKGTRVTYTVCLQAAGLLVKALGKAIDVGAIHKKVITGSLERLAAQMAG